MEIRTIGLDLAKQVFQIHGVNEAGDVVVKRRLRRARVISYFASLPACLIGIEACATAHFWGARAALAGTRRAPDAAPVRQGLREAWQE